MRKYWYPVLGAGALLFAGAVLATKVDIYPFHGIGEPLDSLNGVQVFYNGAVGHVSERNLAPDGYNLGLKYQCVEFVKRYYYEHYQHKMPNDRGHARDFFDAKVPNGGLNRGRGLAQFTNGGGDLPVEGDLVVFAPWVFNLYGHVAIVSQVGDGFIEVIQQNPGPFGSTRERYSLIVEGGKPRVIETRLLGWLRKVDLQGNSSKDAATEILFPSLTKSE